MMRRPPIFSFFFFNDTATTEIYTLSLHDALPISGELVGPVALLGELTVDTDHDTLGAEAGAEGIDETRGGERWGVDGDLFRARVQDFLGVRHGANAARDKIGRASCRERV